MKEKDCGKFKEALFGAGKAFDDFGRPTPFWSGVVAYQWSAEKQAFLVCATQVLGTGTASNTYYSRKEASSCDEINKLLDYFRELERHYKKVYGE